MNMRRFVLSSCLALLGCFLPGCVETHVADGDTGAHDGGVSDAPNDSGRDAWVNDRDAWSETPDAFVQPDAFVEPDAWVNPCAACDDHDACNGLEGCDAETGECLPGTPLDCDDGIACSVDSCEPARGCVHVAPDEDGDGDPDCTDCAPTDPAIFDGATEACNATDDDCDGSTDEGVFTWVYADCDGDGWAPETATNLDSCMDPPLDDTGCGTPTQAWTRRVPDPSDFDCADDDERAHSTTTGFYSTGIATAFPEVDFDFNCDFVEEPEFPAAGSCVSGGAAGCVATPGWETTVPDCGESGTFIVGCTAGCTPNTEARAQACR